jgi:demethylsterigmatocystin 6-O-methyltransferase
MPLLLTQSRKRWPSLDTVAVYTIFFDNIGPVLQVLPSFLSETKYQDVTDASNTAFQKAFPTDLPAFMWLPSQPERFRPLQQVMTVQGAAGVPWFSVFPFEKELGAFTGPHVLVDVGGGFGHQSAALLSTFQQLHGKMYYKIYRKHSPNFPPHGIEAVAHDFFQRQPVKGARFYYLRNILHDWPDDKSVAILKQIIAALGPNSQI